MCVISTTATVEITDNISTYVGRRAGLSAIAELLVVTKSWQHTAMSWASRSTTAL